MGLIVGYVGASHISEVSEQTCSRDDDSSCVVFGACVKLEVRLSPRGSVVVLRCVITWRSRGAVSALLSVMFLAASGAPSLRSRARGVSAHFAHFPFLPAYLTHLMCFFVDRAESARGLATTQARKSEHAKMLRRRGARVVVNDMKNLIPLVDCFTECMAKGEDFCLPIANLINTMDRKGVWG